MGPATSRTNPGAGIRWLRRSAFVCKKAIVQRIRRFAPWSDGSPVSRDDDSWSEDDIVRHQPCQGGKQNGIVLQLRVKHDAHVQSAKHGGGQRTSCEKQSRDAHFGGNFVQFHSVPVFLTRNCLHNYRQWCGILSRAGWVTRPKTFKNYSLQCLVCVRYACPLTLRNAMTLLISRVMRVTACG